MSAQKSILIGGPTASGKSALALQIARQCNGTIINADAMQIYAGLPILTAQPGPQDRAEIPHLLYEVTDAAEASSAGKWLTQTRAAIAQVLAQNRTPILVGGTGMYFKALLGGLADIPEIPQTVRAETSALYDSLGEEKFRGLLAQRDTVSAARIARNDRQRLIRAYEVVAHTGKTLGEWQRQGTGRNDKKDSPPPRGEGQGGGRSAGVAIAEMQIDYHLLMPPRDELYAACDRRFTRMIELGALDEVEKLLARNLPPSLPAMKILGVRELTAYLRGEATKDEAIARAQQMTRNYAKRQMTWFRNQWQRTGLTAVNHNG